MDALIVVGQISGKDWLMMGNSVAQVPDGLKTRSSAGTRP
jgi:hypothetical protein